ncbi:MAG: phenylalanine--tRNA ligase subunit beta [Patescibacteria group bacterium]
MKVSYNWLQNHIEEKLPTPEQVAETIHTHAFEVESTEKIGNDTIFDIAVLPDRAHDCLSHVGIAKEVAGLLGLTLKKYPLPPLPESPLSIKVEIQSDLCRRYIAVEMTGVKVGPSPSWLKEALEGIGARSINNIVDATNLVLFDDGQPVHAFDKAKIDGGIVVRMAHEGEQIVTLSKEEKKLSVEDLVIVDYLGPLAIAGVKGGASAEVTEETKDIIIEIGNFDPVTVRKTSKRLALQTDASKRFENELSPEIAYGAAKHVVALIQSIAGGEVVGIFDEYKSPQKERTLSFKLSDITRVLGSSINEAEIDLWISRYKMVSTKKGGTYTITIPPERLDISIPEDVAEEVGRLVGYDHIPSTELPKTVPPRSPEYEAISATKLWLAENGFREVMNYTFTKKGEVYVAYGPKDKSALRANLSDGLKESYEKNRLNSALLGLDTIRIFEIGTVFSADKEEIHVATVDKGTFEELPLATFIEKYKIDVSQPISLKEFPSGKFKMWSLYPVITRDISVWITGTDRAGLSKILDEFATKYNTPYYIFDEFSKDGRTSIASRFIFQSYEKTLTEAEVEKWFAELVEKIKENKDFEIR